MLALAAATCRSFAAMSGRRSRSREGTATGIGGGGPAIFVGPISMADGA